MASLFSLDMMHEYIASNCLKEWEEKRRSIDYKEIEHKIDPLQQLNLLGMLSKEDFDPN